MTIKKNKVPLAMKRGTIISVTKTWQHLLIIFIILCATFIIYGDVGRFEFVNFDDDLYVWNNPYINKGMSLDGIKWAFSLNKTTETWTYWHPLTSLSHMIDVELFGLDAGKHHIVNFLFHIINVILLYFVFYWITGAFWQCALVAALFAIHPLNVDTVAWVAERKNLLSTTCWILSMAAYVNYTIKPSLLRYLIIITTLCAGLMAKPMLVTLPCVFLLMDFWPLGRHRYSLNHYPSFDGSKISKRSIPHLILEKLPLLAVSFISIIISIVSLKMQSQIANDQIAPLAVRAGNAFVSYIKYIYKILWPRDMVVYYPFPNVVPAWQIIGALILLGLLSFFVITMLKKKPALAFGWFWFLGTLTPVIGIIQGGVWPAMADRWTYIPAIGIFIMIAWGIIEHISKLNLPRAFTSIILILISIPLIYIAINQVSVWQNSITLFTHALEVTGSNYLSHYNIAEEQNNKGNENEAVYHYTQAIKSGPNFFKAYNNLANIYVKYGNLDKAIRLYYQAIKVNPRILKIRLNLGKVLVQKGLHDQAIEHFKMALKINPENFSAHEELGKVFAKKGLFDEAIIHLKKTTKLRPESASAFNNLGNALAEKGEIDMAIKALQQALDLDHRLFNAHNSIANAFFRKGRMVDALYHYEFSLSGEKENIFSKNRNMLISSIPPNARNQIFFKTAVRFAEERNFNKAIELFQKVLENEPANPRIFYNISCLYAIQNQKKKAVEWLKLAVEQGFKNWNALKNDPDLQNIRQEPYVKKLIEKHIKSYNPF